MDEPAVATDSSGVPSTIEKSPLDFANEVGASDQGTAAPEMPPPEDVLATAAPGVGQAEEAVAAEPAVARKSRSSHGGKSLAAMQLCLASNVFVSEGAPANVSDPDLLSFADAPSHHTVDVAQSSLGVVAAEDPKSENASSPTEVGSPGSLRLRFEKEAKLLRKSVAQVARRDKRIEARELEIKNLEALLETEADMKRATEDKSDGLIKELKDMRARFSDLQVSHGQLSQQVASLKEQVNREEKLKAAFEQFKQYEDEPAFADVVSAGVAKGMSEGLKHGVEHGRAQLTVESIETHDPEAEAKFVAALQSLKDLKYPLLDQLEGLKDAPMDLTILVYPEVRDPRNPWAYKEEIKLSDAIAANISRAEKKKKCRIVCRTHGVGFAHHAMSDGVPVSVPTVVPQGLALLLVDAATQTDLEDA
nr:hypothetical protein [Tanacetum cinerariifolium]